MGTPKIAMEEFLFLGADPGRPGLRLPSYSDRLEANTWPGVDGPGLWNLGKRAEAVMAMSIRDESTPASAQLRIKNYEVLAGRLQAVETANGVMWENIAVELLDAKIVPISTPAGSYLSGGTPTCLLIAWWSLRRTQSIT